MPFVTWLKRHLVVIAGLLTLSYLLLPNVVVTVFSFNKPKGRFNYEWQQFSTDAWKDPCGVADMCGSLGLSLQIAVWATIGATALGTMIAFALVRYRFRARGAVNSLIFLPMAMPEVVMAASLLTLFLNMGAQLGFWTILIAHIMFCLSFVVTAVKARVMSMDPRLEQAAQDLYAGPAQTFLRVTLPIAAPESPRARCSPSRSPSTISSSPISTRARPSRSPCSSGVRHSAEHPFRSMSSVRPCSSSPSCSSCSEWSSEIAGTGRRHNARHPCRELKSWPQAP